VTQTEKSPVGGGADSQTKNWSSSPPAFSPESLAKPDFSGQETPDMNNIAEYIPESPHKQQYKPIDVIDFMKLDLPPRSCLMSPWLPEKSSGSAW